MLEGNKYSEHFSSVYELCQSRLSSVTSRRLPARQLLRMWKKGNMCTDLVITREATMLNFKVVWQDNYLKWLLDLSTKNVLFFLLWDIVVMMYPNNFFLKYLVTHFKYFLKNINLNRKRAMILLSSARSVAIWKG